MNPESSTPLPCRGCQADCPNRSHCQGKPWRTDFKPRLKPPTTPRH